MLIFNLTYHLTLTNHYLYFLQMSSSKQSGAKDLSTNILIQVILISHTHRYFIRWQDHYKWYGSESAISNDQTLLTDPKECKRQQERGRYAQLSYQRKNELLKKHREAHQRKKIIADFVDVEHGQIGSRQCTLCKKVL